MSGVELGVLGALAWLLLGKRASARPAPAPPAPAPPAPSGVVVIPETVIRASAPAPSAVPWPAASSSKPVIVPAMGPISRTAPAVITAPATAVRQNEVAALIARERAPFDASYWMPAKRVTPAEAASAKALLASPTWKANSVVFGGPATFEGRRQFRAQLAAGKRTVTIWQPRPPFV